jgi:crossover junction endodeoxyribonuclease RuvC
VSRDAVALPPWTAASSRPRRARWSDAAALFSRASELIEEHDPAEVVAPRGPLLRRERQLRAGRRQARGVVMLAAGQRGIPCAHYTPQQVKSAVCGSGRADKEQVIRMVQAVLTLAEPPSPDHAADALAVAICHANRAAFGGAVQAAGADVRGSSRPTSALAAAIAAAEARA